MLAAVARLRQSLDDADTAPPALPDLRTSLNSVASALNSLPAPEKTVSSLKEAAAIAHVQAQQASDAEHVKRLKDEREYVYGFIAPSADLLASLESAANLVGLVSFREGNTLSLGGQITVIDFVVSGTTLSSIKLSYDLQGHREQPAIADVLRRLIEDQDWTHVRTTLAYIKDIDLEMHTGQYDAFNRQLEWRTSLPYARCTLLGLRTQLTVPISNDMVLPYFPTTVLMDTRPDGQQRLARIVGQSLLLDSGELAIPATLASHLGMSDLAFTTTNAIETLPKRPYAKVDLPYELKFSFSTTTPFVRVKRIAFRDSAHLQQVVETVRHAYVLQDLLQSCASSDIEPPRPSTVEELMSLPRTILRVNTAVEGTSLRFTYEDDNDEHVSFKAVESAAFVTRHAGLLVEAHWKARMT